MRSAPGARFRRWAKTVWQTLLHEQRRDEIHRKSAKSKNATRRERDGVIAKNTNCESDENPQRSAFRLAAIFLILRLTGNCLIHSRHASRKPLRTELSCSRPQPTAVGQSGIAQSTFFTNTRRLAERTRSLGREKQRWPESG